MNDRFRFRVWNTRTKKLREVAQITLDARQHGRTSEISNMETCHLAYQPHLVLEQCTGLKDKNGRLIYEGDIVNILCEIEEQGVIEWAREEAQFVIRAEQAGFVANFDNYSGIDLEVIGNIHENADLLEGSK